MLSIVLLSPLARVAPRALARRLARLLGWVGLVLLCLLGTAAPARAEDAPALEASLLENVRSLALGKVAETAGARVEVTLGQLDPRLRLAPCQSIEPYLPAGVRLWGKSRIGLRCKVGPTPWSVYLPITVKVFGRALVVPAGAIAGSVIAETDLAEAEVDLAEESTPALVEATHAVGRVLAQNLKPGQTLRQAHLKTRQWFAVGETVRVIAAGPGFTLEGEGQAISNGIEGQPARVRTESGRILTGTPSGERRIEVSL
ncbi:MAG: flagellar basal body P-ring formation chaperone FlgA [Burkholderiales bacterium]|nr:flagellar basal body P-ring formation chaperone FlgA [Burkholderiales bacterium]